MSDEQQTPAGETNPDRPVPPKWPSSPGSPSSASSPDPVGGPGQGQSEHTEPTQIIPTPAPAAPMPPPGQTYAPPPSWPPHAATPSSAAPVQPAYAPPPGYAPPYAPAGYPSAAYPPGVYPNYPVAPQTSTKAIVGLVLAILSWVFCPVIPAIVAVILAHASTREIEDSQGRVDGAGLNTATRIISWINIGVFAALIVGFGLFFLVVAILSAANPQ